MRLSFDLSYYCGYATSGSFCGWHILFHFEFMWWISRQLSWRRNLRVGCVSSWWPLFPSGSSVYIIIYICIFIWVILTHWGRVTHICVGNLTTIVSDNGMSPGRRQAIIWTNWGILLIGPLGTNFSEILIEIKTVSFKKMFLKVSSAKWRPFCLGINV